MKQPKIVFMGTPEFAVASLKALVDHPFEIVGVITAPDRPAGRGRKMRASAVKEFALSRKLNVMQPSNLKDPAFLDTLRSLEADLQVVVAFRMLPEKVWAMPPMGTFNLHASLLPEYRGAAPINWAVINGETKTGNTTFFINEAIDTGAVLLQREMLIHEDDTAGSLHDRLMLQGSELVVDTVKLIASGKARPSEQPKREFKAAPKLNKDNSRIDWTRSMEDIYNHIRGLSPYPGAWTVLDQNGTKTECKIFFARQLPVQHNYPPGTIRAEKKELFVAVDQGLLRIEQLQLSGKRKMKSADLLNGFNFDQGDRFE